MIIKTIKNQQFIQHIARTSSITNSTGSCTGGSRTSGAKVGTSSIVNTGSTRNSNNSKNIATSSVSNSSTNNGIVTSRRFLNNYYANNNNSKRQQLPVVVVQMQQHQNHTIPSQSGCCTNVKQQRIRYFSTTNNNHSNSLVTDTTNNNNNATTTNNEQLVSADGLSSSIIDSDIASKIEGNESQIVTIQIEPGQIIRAESGAMMYMTDGIVMNTTTGSGGISSGFQRVLTGQNFFISDYTYQPSTTTTNKKGTVAFGTDFPSKIIRLNIQEYNNKLICQKGALLCANHTIDIQMEFSKNITTGFFGGEGFVLQGLTGVGDVFLKASGTLIKRTLHTNEQLRISSGCLVAFSNGIDYDVQMVKGFTNVIAGGEGLFITTLTGPGTVWLQGQPPQRMISEIARRVPSGGGGIGLAIPIPGMGSGSGSSGGSSGSGGTESSS